jgi:hypothetical protein
MPAPLDREKDDNPAWLMILIACYIDAWAVWASWSRHSWLGIAGVYVITGGILWCIIRLNRAAKRRSSG